MATPREPSEMRILSVAGEHLRQHGLRRFTVVAVAVEAGMTHANVYRYFPSRTALIDAVVDVWLKATERSLADIADGPDPEDESEIDLVLGLGNGQSDDVLYDQAVAIVAKDRKCSTSYIQRKLAIGYNKAARLVEMMEDQGVVSQANHVGKREVLVPER